MLQFLNGILDSVMTAIEGFISFFRLIVNVVLVVLDFIIELPTFFRFFVNWLADVPAYLAWLPGAAIPVCVIIFIIAIIWKIFGRT